MSMVFITLVAFHHHPSIVGNNLEGELDIIDNDGIPIQLYIIGVYKCKDRSNSNSPT